jgi:nitroreductase
MANPNKAAHPDTPIIELLQKRWSPYVFSDKAVSTDDLKAIFEAARWAPSSYNEQPWRYFVATKDQTAAFEKILSCLVEGNQAWAKQAPVLGLGIIKKNLAMNNQPNRAALHDLGAASMSLTTEATQRGLFVHQMIGIEPDKVRELFNLPDDAEAYTGLAIGYPGDLETAEETFKTRDNNERSRNVLADFVFQDNWEKPMAF